jgi:hypothetical protein
MSIGKMKKALNGDNHSNDRLSHCWIAATGHQIYIIGRKKARREIPPGRNAWNIS